MKASRSFYSRCYNLIASRQFFVGVATLFVLESAWIALSGGYPMAFDESFHLGIIRLYAHQWSPFFAHQPVGADQYGAVTRDPSYLYHYLMSFPDRLVTHLSSSQTVEVLVLRFIDIALFTWALILFRKLLLKTKAPVAWVHLVLLYFIMIPVVPLLAGQINYDDLLIPLTALSLLWTIELVGQWRKSGNLHFPRLMALVVLLLLTSLVKYAFLPFFVVMVIYLIYELFRLAQRQSQSIIGMLWRGMTSLKPVTFTLLLVAFLIAFGLFMACDGYNVLKYGTPSPQCNQVLSVSACQPYSPWQRNYVLAQEKISVDSNPLRFTASWFYGMFDRSYFAVNGPENDFVSGHPIPILAISSVVVGVWGVLLAVFYRRSLLKKYPYLKFLIVASLTYVAVLWIQNYSDYLHLDQTVAINGRYLFPALPPLLLTLGLAYRQWLRRWPQWAKGWLIVLVFLLFAQGAGTLTFIIRSDNGWYWPYNRAVQDTNRWTRDSLRYVILH